MNPSKHICLLCGYIYDDSKGDPALGISTGTKFYQLSSDFRHPDCSASADMFEACTCVHVETSAYLARRDLLCQPLSVLVDKNLQFAEVFDKHDKALLADLPIF